MLEVRGGKRGKATLPPSGEMTREHHRNTTVAKWNRIDKHVQIQPCNLAL